MGVKKKKTIDQRNIASIQGDITQSRELHRQVGGKLKRAKDNNKDKVQGLLRAGNSRPDGVKCLMD